MLRNPLSLDIQHSVSIKQQPIGEDANGEIALARSLVDRMDEGGVRRHWSRMLNTPNRAEVRLPVPGSWLWLESAEPLPVTAPVSITRRRRLKVISDSGDGFVRRPAGLLF
jgi:hypothetical protein